MKFDYTKFERLVIPLTFPVVLWVIHLISFVFKTSLRQFGVLPRNFSGIYGIITSPLIHGSFSHLISNTAPLVILGLSIFYFYPKSAYRSFIIVYAGTGLLVWLFGREVYHIGASGIVYGYVSFLFFNGLFRKDNKSIALSLLVVFLYGGLVWGVLPGMPGISWESHFFGAVMGLIAAFIFRKTDPQKKYDWEDEEETVPKEKLEISYDADRNDF